MNVLTSIAAISQPFQRYDGTRRLATYRFLTPDGNPFFGGTYFPPNDSYGRPGFKRVLLTIADAFREKNDRSGRAGGRSDGDDRPHGDICGR